MTSTRASLAHLAQDMFGETARQDATEQTMSGQVAAPASKEMEA